MPWFLANVLETYVVLGRLERLSRCSAPMGWHWPAFDVQLGRLILESCEPVEYQDEG